MYLTSLSPEESIGHILRHNLTSFDGRKTLSKGHRLRAEDLATFQQLGITEVRVAVLEAGDVHEDEAARRLATVVCGPGVVATSAVHSRVNLLAVSDGVAQIDVDTLLQINQIDGLTIATVPTHTLVRARKRVATIKIIPFAVSQIIIEQAEAVGRASQGVIQLQPLRSLPVGVILVGSPAAHQRMTDGVFAAIEQRVISLGSTVVQSTYLPADEAAIAQAISTQQRAGVALMIVAGETSIMDQDDVTPRAIRLAGGWIEHYGAPVEPGNLLLLGYLPVNGPPLPILGAPGCVRSRDTNIVDLLLPRLLAGEHVSRQAIIRLGHGGLLS